MKTQTRFEEHVMLAKRTRRSQLAQMDPDHRQWLALLGLQASSSQETEGQHDRSTKTTRIVSNDCSKLAQGRRRLADGGRSSLSSAAMTGSSRSSKKSSSGLLMSICSIGLLLAGHSAAALSNQQQQQQQAVSPPPATTGRPASQPMGHPMEFAPTGMNLIPVDQPVGGGGASSSNSAPPAPHKIIMESGSSSSSNEEAASSGGGPQSQSAGSFRSAAGAASEPLNLNEHHSISSSDSDNDASPLPNEADDQFGSPDGAQQQQQLQQQYYTISADTDPHQQQQQQQQVDGQQYGGLGKSAEPAANYQAYKQSSGQQQQQQQQQNVERRFGLFKKGHQHHYGAPAMSANYLASPFMTDCERCLAGLGQQNGELQQQIDPLPPVVVPPPPPPPQPLGPALNPFGGAGGGPMGQPFGPLKSKIFMKFPFFVKPMMGGEHSTFQPPHYWPQFNHHQPRPSPAMTNALFIRPSPAYNCIQASSPPLVAVASAASQQAAAAAELTQIGATKQQSAPTKQYAHQQNVYSSSSY